MDKQWKISNDETLFLLDDLYDVQPKLQRKESSPKQNKNSKSIGIILNEEPSTQTSLFISKVMQSVNKSETDFDVYWNQDTSDIAPEVALRFGVNTNTSDLYTTTKQDGIITCDFDSIHTIMTDTSKKRLLWECLKTTFKMSQN